MGSPPRTLTECLFLPIDDATELEKFRLRFEAEHGKTDLNKYYTSQWPTEQRDWLVKSDPEAYYEGLPPFVKAYLLAIAREAARDGRLDDQSDDLIRLYISGKLGRDDRGEGFSR